VASVCTRTKAGRRKACWFKGEFLHSIWKGGGEWEGNLAREKEENLFRSSTCFIPRFRGKRLHFGYLNHIKKLLGTESLGGAERIWNAQVTWLSEGGDGGHKKRGRAFPSGKEWEK